MEVALGSHFWAFGGKYRLLALDPEGEQAQALMSIAPRVSRRWAGATSHSWCAWPVEKSNHLQQHCSRVGRAEILNFSPFITLIFSGHDPVERDSEAILEAVRMLETKLLGALVSPVLLGTPASQHGQHSRYSAAPPFSA